MTYTTVKTIWIIFISLCLGTVIFGLFSEVLRAVDQQETFSNILFDGCIGSLFLFFTYGIIFWFPVLVFMLVFELATLGKKSGLLKIQRILGLEWLLVSLPFVVWALTEDYLAWFYHILILGLGQFLRIGYLKKKFSTNKLN